MSLAGGVFSALSGVLSNAFLILLTAVFILLEAADLPKKLRLALKKPGKIAIHHREIQPERQALFGH